jgi:L-lactate utilization protein LutB
MPHPAKTWRLETLGRKTVDALKRNNFGAVYAADAAEACDAILEMIPEGATVGFGGSMTLQGIGLFERLQSGRYDLINPPWKDGDLSREDRVAARKRALSADVFLTGTNAVTLDGKLVNTDATGNRVGGMLFGPKKTIVAVGVNKLVPTLDDALDRVTNVASPENARRLGLDTPCTTGGECADCHSPRRICNATVILHRKTSALDMTVVMIGEELGL